MTELFQESVCSKLASFVIKHSNMLAVGGAKTLSLISAHHLIGTYFLTTKSDKRMCLLTRLYGITGVMHLDVEVQDSHLGKIADLMSEWEGPIADQLKLTPSDVANIKTAHPRKLNLQT